LRRASQGLKPAFEWAGVAGTEVPAYLRSKNLEAKTSKQKPRSKNLEAKTSKQKPRSKNPEAKASKQKRRSKNPEAKASKQKRRSKSLYVRDGIRPICWS
jgi:hypothetical protein